VTRNSTGSELSNKNVATEPVHYLSDVRMVSFIIPAWNEEALLGQTLARLKAVAEELPVAHEVIVVDDGSTDRTAQIARDGGAKVVAVNRRQISATRNAGAKAALGDVFIFVDADTLVTPEAVRAALEAIRSGAVGGGCAVKFDGPIPLYARLLVPAFVRMYRAAGLAAGCFLFCTRWAFEAVGGFSEELFASEECRLSWALGRVGRFVILRESVQTSSRKLRTYSGWEIFSLFFGLAVHGNLKTRDRKGMEIWYGPRRKEPGTKSV
jgi:glycosyltransferase involved in cell wall biosynthesis